MDYTNFFIASTGASAAFIGLLFVAITVNTNDESSQQRRMIYAGSAFISLVDAFFISLVGLSDIRSLPILSLVLSVAALLSYYRFTKKSPWGSTTDVIYSVLVILLYLTQFVAGVVYIKQPANPNIVQWLVPIVIGLYVGALRRAWEITGVKKLS